MQMIQNIKIKATRVVEYLYFNVFSFSLFLFVEKLQTFSLPFSD